MAFQNNPRLQGEQGEGQVKRYVHQPLHVDHFGIHAEIKPNGHVVITGPAQQVKGNKDEVEYDEVEIPASLIFKLANLLKVTRSVTYADIVPAGTKSEPEPGSGK